MRFFFVLLSLIFSVCCAAQKKQKKPSDLKSEMVNIETVRTSSACNKLPFAAVNVLDYRFDTTKVGFTGLDNPYTETDFFGFSWPSFKIIAVKRGLRHSAEKFYNNYFRDCFTANGRQLLVVIKRFWADPFPNVTNPRFRNRNAEKGVKFNLYVKVEFLLHGDSLYMPLKRVDTLIQVNAEGMSEDLNRYNTDGFNIFEYALIKAFESVNFDYYAGKFDVAANKKTKSEIIAFNEKRFKQPILTDTVLKKGVYLNYREFLSNNPSLPDYVLTSDKKAGKALYHFSPGDNTRIVQYYGYCDGKDIFLGDLLYPLTRVCNTFDFFTSRKFIHDRAMYFPDRYTGWTLRIESEMPEPFQVDMETGAIY